MLVPHDSGEVKKLFGRSTRSHFKNTFVTVYAIGGAASFALSRVLNGLKGRLRARACGRLASPPISSPSRQSIFEMTSSAPTEKFIHLGIAEILEHCDRREPAISSISTL